MLYKLSDIARDVKITLDRNANSAPLLAIGDIDTLSLEDIIRSKVVEAVQTVHCTAPLHLLDSGLSIDDELFWEDKGSGWILLPDDFMRLVVFQMSDWAKPVYIAGSFSDSDYALQSSPFKGLRGTPTRPKCYIGVRQEGQVLEFYSCKSRDAQLSRAVYMPYPTIDKYNAIEICTKCYKSVVYTIAALAALSLGDKEKGQNFLEMAKSLLV